MDDLAMLGVEGYPGSWQWYVGHPKGKRLSVVAGTFIDFLYQQGPHPMPEDIDRLVQNV